MNPNVKGYFLHEDEGQGWDARLGPVKRGFTLFGWTFAKWREKQTFIFTENEDTPLTFIQDNGDQIRPCLPGESFTFDFGSIPNFGQTYVRKEGPEYAYHDRGYDVGYLWVKAFGSTVWQAVAFTRNELDCLLRTMSRCTKEPRGRFKAGVIHGAVFSFGWLCGYEPARLPLPEPVDGRHQKPDVDDTI